MTRGLGTCRAVPDVMRRLVERGLPELVVAGAAGHPDVAHATAAFGPLPGRRADAGLPADLGPAGPKLMTERAILGLVFENRYWHENDHAQAGGFPVLPVQVCLVPKLTGPSGGLKELGDAGTRQPLAPKRPAFPFDQPAPHPVGADIERVPQRQFQAIRADRAAGADRDGAGGLVSRLRYVQGEGEPFVRLEARTGAPGLAVYPAGQFPVGQLARLASRVAAPLGHRHRPHLPPCPYLL